MLPVVVPTGFSEIILFVSSSFNVLSGLLEFNEQVRGLSEDDGVISMRRWFMYGPERSDVVEYMQYDEGSIYSWFEPFELSDDEAENTYNFRGFGWLLEKGVANERIDGCFEGGSERHIDDFGTSFLITRNVRYCFRPDGSFAIGNGDSQVDREANILQADLYSRGRYRIDGHAIRMLFDSGFQLKGAFGWIDRSENRVYLLDSYPKLE